MDWFGNRFLDAGESAGAAEAVQSDMDRITSAAGESQVMLQGIAAAMEEQSGTMREIDSGLSMLRSIGNDSATASEEMAMTMSSLLDIAEETTKRLRSFKLS